MHVRPLLAVSPVVAAIGCSHALTSLMIVLARPALPVVKGCRDSRGDTRRWRLGCRRAGGGGDETGVARQGDEEGASLSHPNENKYFEGSGGGGGGGGG